MERLKTMDAQKLRADVCDECPFARTSLPGYLGSGSGDPEGFLLPHYEGGMHLPCHKLVDWESEDAKPEEAPACRGLITLMVNSCKLPLNDNPQRQMVEEVEPDRDKVFSYKGEFYDHHA